MPEYKVAGNSFNGINGVEEISKKLIKGDLAKLNLAGKIFWVTVVEDRGNIGINNRQIVRVKMLINGEPIIAEFPAEELERGPYDFYFNGVTE